MYDYYEAVKNDVIDYITSEIDLDSIDIDSSELEERLCESTALWLNDNVTGNGSGSYTMNMEEAQRYVESNKELVREMCSELGGSERIMQYWFDDDYESIDVALRCYVLPSAINEAISELEEQAAK